MPIDLIGVLERRGRSIYKAAQPEAAECGDEGATSMHNGSISSANQVIRQGIEKKESYRPVGN
jgi:hypothetical protein